MVSGLCGTVVVQERHLWLCLADMRETSKTPFLNAPVSQTGLFGNTVENFAQQFSTSQKQTKAIKHILPWCQMYYSHTLCPNVGKCCTHSDAAPDRLRDDPTVSPSRWLLQTIRLSYAIQFARHPPKFRGVHFTSANPADAPVLRA